MLYLESSLPEGGSKDYFYKLLEKKEHIFPAFIPVFTGGHFTTNIAESINNVIRTLKKSSNLVDEISLLENKLPSDIYESRIRLTKFEKNLVEKSPLLSYYQQYTDYALSQLLASFAESQSYSIEKKESQIEVYTIAVLERDGTKIEYKKDVQTVNTHHNKLHCSCNSISHARLICKHIISVFSRLYNQKNLDLLHISQYWKKDAVNYDAIKIDLIKHKEQKKQLSQDNLSRLKNIMDPSHVKSKGRPKEHKRILGLYEKLKQLDKKQSKKKKAEGSLGELTKKKKVKKNQ